MFFWTTNKNNYPSLKSLYNLGGGIINFSDMNKDKIHGLLFPNVNNVMRKKLMKLLPIAKTLYQKQNLDKFASFDLSKFWQGLRPRTQNAIMGAGLGTIPGLLYGGITGTGHRFKSALKWGGIGALTGGGLGYLSPLSIPDIYYQTYKGNLGVERRNIASILPKYKFHNMRTAPSVAREILSHYKSPYFKRRFNNYMLHILEAQKNQLPFWTRLKLGYSDIFGE